MKRKAVFLLYRVLQALGSPLILFYLVLRGLRNPRYFRSLAERCGKLDSSWQQTVAASIWLHAVSAGEIAAAVPLILQLKQRHPGTAVFVSTGTLAGYETAGVRLTGLVSGFFFAPIDTVWAVRRVLRRIRPSVVVVLETEIWPNLFCETKRIGCGLLLANGRISDRSRSRYRRLAPLFSTVLTLCDRILTQSEEMRVRFVEAGAPPEIVQVAGNLKYDGAVSGAGAGLPGIPAIDRFLAAGDSRPLWIAASTCGDGQVTEEEFVIAAQRGMPGWRLIIAPRQPARFEDAARRLAASGLRWTRRSDPAADAPADVLLLDSIGELSPLFIHAQVVFMGGTLAARGGHNILEPAIFGKPVIVGPHMENFRDIAVHFERRGALLRIENGSRLRDAVLSAAADSSLGERARAAAEEQRGAASRIAGCVTDLYERCYPMQRKAQPAQALLCMLAMIWKAASARDRARKQARIRRLPVPVVSVGNVTAGGTGKTPMTIELLHDFRAFRPAVLIRGHGRGTRETLLLLKQGEKPVSLTGDEAQLCSRAAQHAPIGIGADRYASGTLLLQETGAGMFFLDDGFQHLQLHRDFDLVLIDSLNPFGGGELLPLGFLREPLEGLARAHAFVITRSRETPNLRAIENVIRRYNPHAPVFRARTDPRQWAGPDGVRLEPGALKGTPAVAFCGLGNPESFWKSLARIGIDLLDRHDFEDHHRYTPAEIRRLARHAGDVGAAALLTTAKDAVNLDADYPSIIAPLKLYWLEIGLEIDRREELVALIAASVNKF